MANTDSIQNVPETNIQESEEAIVQRIIKRLPAVTLLGLSDKLDHFAGDDPDTLKALVESELGGRGV